MCAPTTAPAGADYSVDAVDAISATALTTRAALTVSHRFAR